MSPLAIVFWAGFGIFFINLGVNTLAIDTAEDGLTGTLGIASILFGLFMGGAALWRIGLGVVGIFVAALVVGVVSYFVTGEMALLAALFS